MTRRVPPTPDEAKAALKAWATLYAIDLDKPHAERRDKRLPHELSDAELFSIEIGDPVYTARIMRAEAVTLGKVGEHFKDETTCCAKR